MNEFATRESTPEVKAFMAAVRAGRFDEVAAALANDPSLVHAYDYDAFGSTALIHAVQRDDRAMVDLLLDRGADIDQRSDWWAGSFGVLPCDDPEMAAHLIERGATLDAHAAAGLDMPEELIALLDADPALVHAPGGDGQTPLHFAASLRIVDLLLERGAEIDALDIDHASTPAQWNATRRPEVSAHLVDHGAQADIFMVVAIGEDERYDTFLREHPGAVHARVDEANFPAPPPAAGHIYRFTVGNNTTALHMAAQKGRSRIAQKLVVAGLDPNARGGYDDAAPLHQAAWNNRVDVIDVLLGHGAEIDQRSGEMHHNTPLGWAIVSGAAAAVEFLLQRGATVHDFHRADAEAGAAGEFRQFSSASMENWQRIARILQP